MAKGWHGNGRSLGTVRHPETTSDKDIDQAFMAMASYPTLEEASGYLIEHQKIMASPLSLSTWARSYPERYERARNQAAQLREQALAGDLLNVADYATKVGMLGIEQTRTLLEEGKVNNPATASRELIDIASKAVDKKLAIEGRPSRVTVTRSVTEIFNQLEALKVIEGTATEDDADLQ